MTFTWNLYLQVTWTAGKVLERRGISELFRRVEHQLFGIANVGLVFSWPRTVKHEIRAGHHAVPRQDTPGKQCLHDNGFSNTVTPFDYDWFSAFDRLSTRTPHPHPPRTVVCYTDMGESTVLPCHRSVHARSVLGERQRVQTGLAISAKTQYSDDGDHRWRQQRYHQMESAVACAYRRHQPDRVFGRHSSPALFAR